MRTTTSPQSPSPILILVIATAFTLAPSGALAQTNRVIANGNPPLTASMVTRFADLLCWVLEVPNTSTADQIATMGLASTIQNMMIQDWKTPAGIKGDLDFLNWQATLARLTPEERDLVRINSQRDIVNGARANPRRPESQMILSLYDSAHPVIAPGNPPLTRQAADAFGGYLCFTLTLTTGQTVECTQERLDYGAQHLAQNYPAMSPEEQKRISEMPQTFALMRLEWIKSSEAGREKIRAQWRVIPPAEDPQLAAAVAAAERIAAFAKIDPEKVTEQELQAAAKDADTAAAECRRPGSPSYNLQNAATWQQRASEYRLGVAGYRQLAVTNAAASARQQAINNAALIQAQLRNQSHYLNQLHNSLNAINKQADANGRNNAAHVNNSPSDWIVRKAP